MIIRLNIDKYILEYKSGIQTNNELEANIDKAIHYFSNWTWESLTDDYHAHLNIPTNKGRSDKIEGLQWALNKINSFKDFHTSDGRGWIFIQEVKALVEILID